jgi:hypothetical protein
VKAAHSPSMNAHDLNYERYTNNHTIEYVHCVDLAAPHQFGHHNHKPTSTLRFDADAQQF